MPRFFFDFGHGVVVPDDMGTEFPDAHAARDAAIEVLPDIMRERIGAVDNDPTLVLVRDDTGRALFTASLTLAARWLVDDV